MANAETNVVTTTNVVLTLTVEEAQVLREILGRIGGTGDQRLAVNEVSNALHREGFYMQDDCTLQGALRFEDQMLSDPWDGHAGQDFADRWSDGYDSDQPPF